MTLIRHVHLYNEQGGDNDVVCITKYPQYSSVYNVHLLLYVYTPFKSMENMLELLKYIRTATLCETL